MDYENHGVVAVFARKFFRPGFQACRFVESEYFHKYIVCAHAARHVAAQVVYDGL